MGRKIPGKKHRKIKDPYKQNQKRIESLKLKVNNPPSNCDEQEVPKSLLRIMKLKENAIKSGKMKKCKRKKPKRPKNRLPSVAEVLDKEPIEPGMKPSKFIPNLCQKPNESEWSYLKRLDLMTQGLVNEVKFENKFGVEIIKNEQTGEVIGLKNLKKKHSKSKKKKLDVKRKEKQRKKIEQEKNIKDFDQLKDKVQFGEVVHRPPSLPNLKKSKKEENKSQKRSYNNLLLNNVVKSSTSENKMSELQKLKAESERQFIVEAYRKAKKKLIVKN